MAKLITASALLIPLAVYLATFGGGGFDPEALRNQRVLVTGASSGIGEQLAYQYARMGARLVITARREEQLRNISRTCLTLGAAQVHYVAADMAVPEDRAKVIGQVEELLGGLDHIILNHALLVEAWWTGSPENLTLLEYVQRVNFLSYVDMASRALPMLTDSRGRIGVVSSGFGEMGSVLLGIYSPCKFALHGFFSSLRQEQRHRNSGVSVTLVLLGPVATDSMIGLVDAALAHVPHSIMATPEATARAIVEGVAQRHYKTYFDWKLKWMFLLKTLAPEYFEDSIADVLMNDGRTWLARLMLFVHRML